MARPRLSASHDFLALGLAAISSAPSGAMSSMTQRRSSKCWCCSSASVMPPSVPSGATRNVVSSWPVYSAAPAGFCAGFCAGCGDDTDGAGFVACGPSERPLRGGSVGLRSGRLSGARGTFWPATKPLWNVRATSARSRPMAMAMLITASIMPLMSAMQPPAYSCPSANAALFSAWLRPPSMVIDSSPSSCSIAIVPYRCRRSTSVTAVVVGATTGRGAGAGIGSMASRIGIMVDAGTISRLFSSLTTSSVMWHRLSPMIQSHPVPSSRRCAVLRCHASGTSRSRMWMPRPDADHSM